MLKLKLKNNKPLNMSEKEDLEGTGTQSFLQPKEAGKTVRMTSEKNPHALAFDATYGNDNQVDAKGNFSAVFGSASRAEGKRAFAQGTNTFAKGNYSHSEGDNAVAHGNESHAEGYNTLAQGNQSHAEGNDTISKGLSSHAEGISTVAEGKYSHSEGNQSKAGGEGSHSEGIKTEAAGYYSHAEGDNSKVLTALPADGGTSGGSTGGDPSGETWKASEHLGQKGHAEGTNNLVLGYSAHAEGYNTKAYGPISHAEGYNTIAGTKDDLEKGWCAHASGRNTVASFNYSTAMGLGTVANTECETVVGKYNRGLHSLFNVGCGTSEQRDSAFVVAINGDSVFTKNLTVYKNLTVNTDLTVKGIIKCDEIVPLSTTESLKLPSIQVGGDIYSTKNSLQQNQMSIQFDNDEATIYFMNTKDASPAFVCSENLIIDNIYSGVKDDGPFITLVNEGTDKSIKLTKPVKSLKGIVEESTIQASKFIETTPNMTSAVGASGAKYKANSPTTTNNIKLTYRDSEKEYVFDSTDSSSGDISTGGSVTSNILNLFNGFATMKIIYLNTAGENIFEYELPSVMYFDQTEEKKIPLLLPSFDATKEFTTEYRDSSGSTTYYNGSMTMNEGILDFRKSGTTTAYTMPYLKVARAGSSKHNNTVGSSMSGPTKIKFWNPQLSGNNKYIDISSIIIRVRKFN